jgi:protein transport protein HofC
MEFLFGLLLIPAWSAAFTRSKAAQEATLLWTLAVAIEKQFPLALFLETLAEESRGRWRRKLRGLAELLEADLSIPEALEAVPGILPADTLALIRVGANSGNLTGALRDAAHLARRRQESPVVNIQGTFIYLIGVLFVLLLIGGFIMYSIVPKFKAIFAGFNTELPPLTQLVISLSDEWVEYWYIVLLGIPLLIAVLWIGIGFCLATFDLGPGTARRPAGLSSGLWPRLRTPPLLRSLAICIDGGRPLIHGLQALARHHRNASYRSRVAGICDYVEGGDQCWLVLRGCGMLRQSEVSLLETAERVGNLPWALRNIADSIERRALYRFHVAVQFLDPSLVVGMGFAVGVFCVGMFMPLIELLDKLSVEQ